MTEVANIFGRIIRSIIGSYVAGGEAVDRKTNAARQLSKLASPTPILIGLSRIAIRNCGHLAKTDRFEGVFEKILEKLTPRRYWVCISNAIRTPLKELKTFRYVKCSMAEKES